MGISVAPPGSLGRYAIAAQLPHGSAEVRRFNTEASALSDKVRTAAVSRDLPFAQARWCGAAGAKAVETLSDYRNGSFGKAYGVYLRELDLLARAVFVVAPDGSWPTARLCPK